MAAFTRTDLPQNINTVEKLYAWAATLLDAINPTLKIVEEENVNEKVCQLVTKPSPGSGPLFSSRITLPLVSTYASSTDPFWLNVTELSNTVVPAAWKVGS